MPRCAVLLLCAACGSGESGAVLLSLSARAGGFTLEVNGIASQPVLPRSVDEAEVGGRRLELRPDAIAYGVDAAGTGEWRELGGETSRDELFVEGRDEAVAELAAALGAEVVLGAGDMPMLRGDDIVSAAGLADEVAELVEVVPVASAELELAPLYEALGAGKRLEVPHLDAAPHPVFVGADSPLVGAPDLVGLYRCGDERLLVDAAGVFWRRGRCGDRVRVDGSLFTSECVLDEGGER
jgi:hypothetical protein